MVAYQRGSSGSCISFQSGGTIILSFFRNGGNGGLASGFLSKRDQNPFCGGEFGGEKLPEELVDRATSKNADTDTAPDDCWERLGDGAVGPLSPVPSAE